MASNVSSRPLNVMQTTVASASGNSAVVPNSTRSAIDKTVSVAQEWLDKNNFVTENVNLLARCAPQKPCDDALLFSTNLSHVWYYCYDTKDEFDYVNDECNKIFETLPKELKDKIVDGEHFQRINDMYRFTHKIFIWVDPKALK